MPTSSGPAATVVGEDQSALLARRAKWVAHRKHREAHPDEPLTPEGAFTEIAHYLDYTSAEDRDPVLADAMSMVCGLRDSGEVSAARAIGAARTVGAAPDADKQAKLERLAAVVRTALAQNFDDICWRDLYVEMGELVGVKFDPKLLPRDQFLHNCSYFYDCLAKGKSYDTPDVVEPRILLDLLNSAYDADPAATYALMVDRVPCNDKLRNHPTILTIEDSAPVTRTFVGELGLLNGLISASGKVVALKTDPKTAEFLGFSLVDRPAAPQA